MNKSKKKLLYVSLLSGGAALLTAVYRKSQKAAVKFLEDTDMRNSEKIDQMESIDADVDPAEKGLTQPDTEYHSKWGTNCFPQVQLEELEKESNTKSNYVPNL
jgi:GH15 family glucan-1,4-alpha-glucosidase